MKINNLLKYLIAFFLTVSFFPTIGISASNEVLSKTESPHFRVSKYTDEIIVEWEPLAGAKKYIVKYNNEIIYEGTDAQFKNKNLSEGSMSEYELAAIDNNDLILSNSHLKIYTTLSNKEEIGIDTFTTSSSIVLDWPDVDNINQYNIFRNDQLIGVTKDSNFKDSNVSADTKYQYTITGEIPFNSNKLAQVKHDFQYYSEIGEDNNLINNELSQVYTEFKESPYDLIEFSTPVKTLEENSKEFTLNEFENKAQIIPLALASNTWIKINTMILNTTSYPGYVPAPIGSYYYSTDNRTTIGSQGSTRSSLEGSINWSTLAVGQTKSVGWTNRYTKNSNGTYVYVDQRQASDSNVYLGATKKTNSMVDINFLHKAAHPYYALAPNVEYEFRSEIYRDGTTKIRGYHTLFPSLGIFRSDGSGYSTIYTHDQGSRSPWSLYSHKTIDITK